MILWLLGCGEPVEAVGGLDGARLLRRVSLDLRGVVPHPHELDLVEQDPEVLPTLAASWLDDERFQDRYVHLLQERWHTRIDEYLVLFEEYQELEGDRRREHVFERSVGEEALRLAAWVVAEDRPWDDVVLLEGTVANRMLVTLWPLEWIDGEPEGTWGRAVYTDGRPAAGVLTSNGLWWRYYSTVTNRNRGRVAALSRLLLCEDYLNRPVSFENAPALVDEEATEEALRSDPYCVGCHASIDPMAAALFGFWPADEYNAVEVHTYHPEREPRGEEELGVEMAYYGQPLHGLRDLAEAIAADSRFERCAAESTAELLWSRPVEEADFDDIDTLRDAFLEGERRIKPVMLAALDTAPYRDEAPRLVGPATWASAVEELTGWRWSFEGRDRMDEDTYGYRVMAGGVDGTSLTRPQAVPNMSWNATIRRAAQAAGWTAVSSGKLVDESIEELAWLLWAERPTEDDVEAYEELVAAVEAEAGADQARASLISVMLRDPRFVTR